MTTTVMQPDEPDHNVSRPIVLLLNCKENVGYLTPKNEILTQLYGTRIARVGLDFPWDHVYPKRAKDDSGSMLRLLRDYSEFTLQQMLEKLEDEAWMAESARSVLAGALEAAHKQHGYGEPDRELDVQRVKVVIIDEDLVMPDSTLQGALVPWLTSAQFYKVKAMGHGNVPQRIWYEPAAEESSEPKQLFAEDGVTPICKTCGTKMRSAGSAFVCEGCGHVYPPQGN
jgi:hypothetical protein